MGLALKRTPKWDWPKKDPEMGATLKRIPKWDCPKKDPKMGLALKRGSNFGGTFRGFGLFRGTVQGPFMGSFWGIWGALGEFGVVWGNLESV